MIYRGPDLGGLDFAGAISFANHVFVQRCNQVSVQSRIHCSTTHKPLTCGLWLLPNGTLGSHVNCTLVEKRCPGETVEAAESSPTTQRIRQKSNLSSFSDRKRPLDPSRKKNQGPLPANLGFFGTISSNLHFSTFKSPLGPYSPLGVNRFVV